MRTLTVSGPALALVAVFLFLNGCAHRRVQPETAPANEEIASCTSTREFVTALEFLRSQKQFGMGNDEARRAADRVAEGCSGAGKRFVRTTELMLKAGMASQDAVKVGFESAARTDREADAFDAVFRKAFLSEYLDLDLPSSVRLARSLSLDLHGDVAAVRADFERLVDFCVLKSKLDLPRASCAGFAGRVAQKGNEFGGGISGPFVGVFEFLRSEKGPALATAEALNLAEDVISQGPEASNNFIQAFKYASSKSGLDLGRKDALIFARNLAHKTLPKNEIKSSEKASKPEPGAGRKNRD